MKSITCPDCELMSINGRICHETGCPSSWIDPKTGEAYKKECKWCGSYFVPEHKRQMYCDPMCADADSY